MQSTKSHRVAILGLMLESNRFAPVITEEDYLKRVYLAGGEILEDLHSSDPKLPTEIRGFAAGMDERGPWELVPILVGLVEAGGPLDHGFFLSALDEIRTRLRAAGPLDAVYVSNHGAMITTENSDPDGEILAAVREVVGPDVPVVATLDLHGNVSERMVRMADVIVAYQTNPHVDMLARGQDAAAALHEMFAGMKPDVAFIRMPIVPPTVTLLTEVGPYADLMNFGQSLVRGDIVNVSILGGFAYSDTPKNGLAIIVTARQANGSAKAVAERIARRAWDEHLRFVPKLTSLADAVDHVAAVCANPTLPAIALADVADNPGGGGNGNTMWILEALHERGVRDVIIGVVNDPSLAAEAARLGEGARFRAVFNRSGADSFSRRFEADARVVSIRDGDCVGRRGFYAGRRMNLGLSVLLDLNGISVVVISIRTQCADPIFLEMMGLDIAAARAVVVKSRGHFRAGFDEFFGHDQVIEVDAPGLTSPALQRFDFRNIPRPAFPLDPDAQWSLAKA
ncbi:M81 family metallopeptidase [Paragemmobacter straminiformis]|uniref:Microcystinase C n=1 Tax=Paragemmobacter straminiformis TaxID=2045119 RepID=A0A842IC24_9RHOB|nr:M81 family metallopeptidase [Gemmobacter straminiformis]MBC2836664.1 M81 family metallopeptidase [Gemmobacter straminiformis]